MLLTLPMLAMIPDWLRAVLDARENGGLLHSANELPLMMIPILAWLGSDRVAVRARRGRWGAATAGRVLRIAGHHERREGGLRDADGA